MKGVIFSCLLFIDYMSVVCSIQKELFDMELREVCLYSEEGMQKGKHIVHGIVRLRIAASAVKGGGMDVRERISGVRGL